MDNININSKGFNFEGLRLAKKYASNTLKAQESNRAYAELKQNGLNEGIKRNENIPNNKYI